MQQQPGLMELFRRNAEALVGAANVAQVGHRGGGTNMGELSHVMPVVHPFAAAGAGMTHGADFRTVDYEAVAVTPAKALAMTVVDLLSDGARRPAGAERAPPALHATAIPGVRALVRDHRNLRLVAARRSVTMTWRADRQCGGQPK
jgi:hypothetical protein